MMKIFKANYFNAYFFLFQGISSDEITSASTDTTTATSTAITTIGGDGVNSDIPTLGTTATTRHDRREYVPTFLLLQTDTTFPNTTAADSPAEANTTSGTPKRPTAAMTPPRRSSLPAAPPRRPMWRPSGVVTTTTATRRARRPRH